MEKEIFSAVALALTLYSFVPYLYSIKRGETKPHVFSWIIWGITTFIVFLAQLADHGGLGAWPIGLSGSLTFYIAYLAYVKRGDIHITKSDWLFFALALASLPLWYATSNPLWSVILLTIVDTLGFIPTFRKSYLHPFTEGLKIYVIATIRNFISIFALENYSFTTVLFPAFTGAFTIVFIAMVIWRRKLSRQSQ